LNTLKNLRIGRLIAVLSIAIALALIAIALTANEFPTADRAAEAQDGELPPADAVALLDYVLETNPYQEWGTWPADDWTDFSDLLEGGDPHGMTVRIFVNDVALEAAQTEGFDGILPPGSIVVKENYGGTVEEPGELAAVTIMYKVEGFNPEANDWFWLKAPVDGNRTVDASGAVDGCIGCHGSPGNQDYLLRYAFGERPATAVEQAEDPGPQETEEPGDGEMMQEGMLASGLDSPRGMTFADDGTLYITDSGSGGDVSMVGVIGEGTGGGSGRLVAVAPDGTQSVVAYGLPSVQIRNEPLGPSDVIVTDDGIWMALGQGSSKEADTAFNPFSYTVIKVDSDLLRVQEFIDVYSYEASENPAGDDVIDSNPVGLALADDGTLYISDAGANSVFSWTADGGLQTFAAWNDNPVPTGIDIGPNGDIYVGFLSGFPFAEGAARVERYSAAGELVETYEGLTNVVEVMVAEDGTVYATQFGTFSQDQGWQPDSGSVVSVSADGVTTVAEGLNFPYGLAMSPDGELAVSVNSGIVETGSGSVMLLEQ
jgi:hypothetical protein